MTCHHKERHSLSLNGPKWKSIHHNSFLKHPLEPFLFSSYHTEEKTLDKVIEVIGDVMMAPASNMETSKSKEEVKRGDFVVSFSSRNPHSREGSARDERGEFTWEG